jgi:hypothetical protein
MLFLSPSRRPEGAQRPLSDSYFSPGFRGEKPLAGLPRWVGLWVFISSAHHAHFRPDRAAIEPENFVGQALQTSPTKYSGSTTPLFTGGGI